MTELIVDVNVICECISKLKARYTDNKNEYPLGPTIIVEPCEACMNDSAESFIKEGIKETEDRLNEEIKNKTQALKCEVGVRTYFENELNKLVALLKLTSIEEIHDKVKSLLEKKEEITQKTVTKIYYSIKNGGDGSAGLSLMESRELAEIDQKFTNDYIEGWAECCLGWITIESDGPIKIKDEIETVDSVIKEIEEELNTDYIKEYKRKGEYPDWIERLESKLKALKELKR